MRGSANDAELCAALQGGGRARRPRQPDPPPFTGEGDHAKHGGGGGLAQTSASSQISRHPEMSPIGLCQHLSASFESFSTPLRPPSYLPLLLPSGTPVATVVGGEETALPVREDVARARRGSVQGFPCCHYGRRVLDEHIGGTGEGSRKRDATVWAQMPGRQNRSRAAERAGTEIAGGARKSRHVLCFVRLGPAPRFPTSPSAAGSVL